MRALLKILAATAAGGAKALSALWTFPSILVSAFLLSWGAEAAQFLMSQGVPFQFGGTSLLIVVVVVMDFIAQLQAHAMSHQYPGLMKKANLLGGRNSGGDGQR